jgi:hypothetical protein
MVLHGGRLLESLTLAHLAPLAAAVDQLSQLPDRTFGGFVVT